MGRHELREQIFAFIFQTEFNAPEEMPLQIRLYTEDEERGFTQKDVEYVSDRFEKIQSKLPEIDEKIQEVSKNWSIARMGKVELAVLRLGVYEILFDEEIPNSVAINEAVEIAKKFGQENSGSFVNGVLAKFVK